LLDIPTFRLEPGETLFLKGPSGSGNRANGKASSKRRMVELPDKDESFVM
jgi:ABC-type ATPase involved in cell division